MLREMPDETFAGLQKQARKLANQTEDEPPAAAPKKRRRKGKKAYETARLTTESLLSALEDSETADFVLVRDLMFASLSFVRDLLFSMAGLPDRMPATAQFLVPEGSKGPDEPLKKKFVVRFTRGESVALADARAAVPRFYPKTTKNKVKRFTSYVDTYRDQMRFADGPVTFSSINLRDTVRMKTLANTILGLQATFAAENRTVKFTPYYEVSEDRGYKGFSLAVSVTVD